jgi:hypothetical protein
MKEEAGILGNERADSLAGTAAKKTARSKFIPLAHLKLQISVSFRGAKNEWYTAPAHHGSEEIPPPPPKKSFIDGARNSLARCAAQIRTGHLRLAVNQEAPG